MTPPEDPSVTAQQVENGSSSLMDFALAARDQYRTPISTLEGALYFQCLVRQEGSPWRSGSTYLVHLTPDGRVYEAREVHVLVRQAAQPPDLRRAILSALGVSRSDLANLASSDPATATRALGAVSDRPLSTGAARRIRCDYPRPRHATWHTGCFRPCRRIPVGRIPGLPFVLLAGFDLGESHLVPLGAEAIDYGDPSVTARGRGGP